MNRHSMKKALIVPFLVITVTAIIIVGLSFFFNQWLAFIAAILLFVMLIISVFIFRRFYRYLDRYLDDLSGKISIGSNRAVKTMPLGLIVLNENDQIEWVNPFMSERIERNVISDPINEVYPNILKQLEKAKEIEIADGAYAYRVRYSEKEHILYFIDMTEEATIQQAYDDQQPIIATLFLDNYDEITQNMNDTQRSEINSMVTRVISRWAQEHNVYFKRYSSDQFIAYLNRRILRELEETKFDILSQLREKSVGYRAQLTLSIGVGEGSENLIDLGELSQSGLDLALGRGGDQVAIKNMNGNVRFYGGKTDPMEKRTRVRARVISHALKDILLEGDKVIVMGHKRPDLDAIGAAIGVTRFAMMNNLEAYIVLNESDIDPTLRRVMDEIDEKPELKERFVTSDDAWNMMTSRTTLVVVDTHKPEMVIDENILNKANRKVVIDHHRRGESFISSPLLVYMEPYASSTAELVTELLEYQPTEQRLTRLESTVMYAGIIVDTRNFTLRTGSRTFDAASYLRAHGADTILTQHFLKDDIETYINRSELIRTVKLQENGIAIAHGPDDKIYHPVTVAQAADELLSLDGVEAAYVVARREENLIGMSARSLGEFNVQLTMEALGGGGHLTNAATQLEGVTVEAAIEKLQQAINEQLDRSDES
ncbi:DHH family phosphoesterase [Staphylococcus pseudintermedius]|uniref:DHH family phosphoesterase n=1 Tax=Staphylococcus pseudintermedius TaxID=283734 RepID=UPI0001F6C4E4|nr:DHH family phosphoesterase [Staphylococcus pseudintermedius]ADV06966.1 Phosphoesterase, DHH family protein [Staphylococcus pseudintermedius HKU10-03]EHD7792532.1 DHH family phosphoesterase [Staphylococcus pseudintermedius]EHT3656912.1 DHH family phosphoesterase [Staphylococcus pseudintermedius]EII2016996.1 DHH family phosphoesterase [Staphylococcus pseudintermedius]EIS6270023.1 DHH family phosphoesterase [Staphylococcus pseudintermedius]